MNRRSFLAASASPLLFAGFGFAAGPIGRTRPSHLKLSLAAYSFRQWLDLKVKKLDLFDFVNLAADYAIDGVELTSYYFPTDVGPSYLHKLKQHAFNLGLDISGTSVGNNFCLPKGPKLDAQYELVRTWIDRAAELDAPTIRIFAGSVAAGSNEDEAVAQTIDGINACLPYAIEKGVTLALENHGGITATPKQLLRLVQGVKFGNFGVNLDTGNFHGEDVYADLAELAPYAVNVQVKTEITPKGGKKQEADLAKVIKVLRDAKYSGYVVLEYEAAEDAMVAVPRHLKTLRNLISG